MKKFIFTAILALSVSPIYSVTIYVPADQPTIQAGIDAASNGDTVLLESGIYQGSGNYDISFHGKAIVLMSLNGPEVTIIDLKNELSARQGLFLDNNEDTTTKIIGITIRNAAQSPFLPTEKSGAVFCKESSPRFINCRFESNRAKAGGAAYCINSSPIFENCLFERNDAFLGGALYIDSLSSPKFYNCVFVKDYYYVVVCNFSNPEFTNCTFHRNTGGIKSINSNPIFLKCIIAYSEKAVVDCQDNINMPVFECSNIYGNYEGDWSGCIASQYLQNGNFSSSPLFCYPGENDFHILNTSECAAENNSCGEDIGAYSVGCASEFRTWSLQSDGTGDVSTIQEAIDLSTHGDTIILDSGIYIGEGNRNIEIGGKQVVIKSKSGSDVTIIDCEGIYYQSWNRAFNLDDGEDSSVVMDGITIKNGFQSYGGAISCYLASPTIRNCQFIDCRTGPYYNPRGFGGAIFARCTNIKLINCNFINNNADSYGGAIILWKSKSTIIGCNFENNTAAFDGGAVTISGPSSYISDCSFIKNSTNYGDGGGLYLTVTNLLMKNCSVIGNSADDGGGIFLYSGDNLIIENTIIAFSKRGESISEPLIWPGNPVLELYCCNIFGNEGGDWIDFFQDQYDINNNLSLDPLFCDTANDDFHLTPESPCAPENNDCEVLIGALDVGCSSLDISNIDDNRLPTEFVLSQNYPNPFNPSTKIEFSLPRRTHVTITIYNILGRAIRTLVDEPIPAGYHTLYWDGKDETNKKVATGVYFYRLITDEFEDSKKMLLLK